MPLIFLPRPRRSVIPASRFKPLFDFDFSTLPLKVLHIDKGIEKVYKLSMQFEFNQQKSELNHAKHGIDFIVAQQLWEDPARVLIPARTSDEPRYM
jgi:hypothetical protein